MTKIIKTFVATVTAMALFASCTKESVHSESVPSENGRMDVRISAVMGELTPVEETKATTTTVIRLYWENGDKVYAYDADKYLGYLDVTPSNNRMDATLTSQEGGIIAPSGDIITLVHCNLAAGITDSDSNGAPDIADGNILFDFKAQGATDPFVLYGTLNVSETSETGEKRSVTDKTVPFEFATSFMSIAVTDMEIMDVDSITVSGINTACKLSVKNNDAPGITGEKDASSSPMTKRGGISQPTSEKQRAMFNLGIVPDNNSGRRITVYQGDNRYGSDFTKSEIKPSKHSISVYEMTAIPSYQITGSASPEEFGAVAFKRADRSVTTAYAGDVITVVATPEEGYEVDQIIVKDSEDGDVTVTDSTFTMPGKEVAVTVTFKKVQYAVSQAACDNGSFTLSPEEGVIDWGTEVTVTPTADTGYELDSISVKGLADTAITVTGGKFTMPQENVTVTVAFKKIKYALSAADCSNGSFTLSPEAGDIDWGTEVTVTPTADTGYELDSILVKGPADTAITVTGGKFTMPQENVTVTVTFKQIEYAIDKASATNGSFVVKKGEVDVTKACYQDEMTVVATPATGYTVDQITVTDSDDGSVTVTDSKFTMPAKGVTVTVIFKKADYAITKATVLYTGGAFTVKKGGVEASTAQYGDAVKIEVTSTPANYEFDRMEVTKTDDATTTVAVGTDGTFTMPAYPVTVTVTFKPTDGASHTTELDRGGLL